MGQALALVARFFFFDGNIGGMESPAPLTLILIMGGSRMSETTEAK